MSIIERYISKEILLSLFGITLVIFIILVGNRFVMVMEEAVSGAVNGKYIFSLLYLNIITQLEYILPFAFYLATLLGLGRLYKDSEMSALAACGVGQARVVRSVLMVSLAMGLVILMLSLYAVPSAFNQIFTLQQISKKQTDVGTFKSGEFRAADDGSNVIYVEDVDTNDSQLNKVFARGHNGGQNYIIIARRGYQKHDVQTDQRYLVLEDGRRYEGVAGQADYKVIEFKQYRLRLDQHVAFGAHTNLVSHTTASLLGSADPHEAAELQWRYSLAIATVILALMAVPLSRTNPRQGRYSKLFVAILIFAVYVMIIATGKVWMEKGLLPPQLGLWWIHALALLFAVAGLLAQSGVRWRFRAADKRGAS